MEGQIASPQPYISPRRAPSAVSLGKPRSCAEVRRSLEITVGEEGVRHSPARSGDNIRSVIPERNGPLERFVSKQASAEVRSLGRLPARVLRYIDIRRLTLFRAGRILTRPWWD